MLLTQSVYSIARDLACVVDSRSKSQSPARRWINKIIEILHQTIGIQECTVGIIADGRSANNLSVIVDSVGQAVIATQRAQILHETIVVQERSVEVAAIHRNTNDVPVVIYSLCLTVSPTQRA